MTVIHYGITPPPLRLAKNDARRQLGLDPDRYTVGFVGRFDPVKNLPILLEAVAGLPEVQVVTIGAGSQEPDLLRHAQSLGLAHWHRIPYRADAADYMPAFDLFCLPSAWEGFGLVLLEAMVRGVPILGSTAGAIPEILDHGRYGLLFTSGNADDLKHKILEAKAKPTAMASMAQAAEAWALRHFTVSTMVERTLETYQRVSTQNNKRRGTSATHTQSPLT